jgi:hypothetical protein
VSGSNQSNNAADGFGDGGLNICSGHVMRSVVIGEADVQNHGFHLLVRVQMNNFLGFHARSTSDVN